MKSFVTRRSLLKASCAAGSLLLLGDAVMCSNSDAAPVKTQKRPDKLTVAVVQYRSDKDITRNLERHRDYIRKCASKGARVVVFPECSVTGFYDEVVLKITSKELKDAEKALCAAAKDAGVYVIAGMPTPHGGKLFNSAVVITPDGKVLERYHKVHLAGESWATPGDHLSVFPVDGVLCSIIICHDERYPELVRLPVIAGARVVFYISHESNVAEKHKIEPYRAQIVARAVENCVYAVHSNAPADHDPGQGSHGQSRIIRPDGNIICEAGIYEEKVLTAELDLSRANGAFAIQSTRCEFLGDWWNAGLSKVRVISTPED